MIQHEEEEVNETRDLDDEDLETVTGGVREGGCFFPTLPKRTGAFDPTL